MGDHFADGLTARIEERGPVCVGLDPVTDRLPGELRGQSEIDAVEQFCIGVIEAVAGVAACVKPQLACFERYGVAGWGVYGRVVAAARAEGLPVIADAKRGDIGISAAHYAAGFLEGDLGADALTINPYLGDDALQPFVDASQRTGRGLFVLVRTSNPGSDALQNLILNDGRTVGQAVADMTALSGNSSVGSSGFSLVGAVVGATKSGEAAELRRRMPQQLFLVPGFGAQGGSAEDVRPCFDEHGRGAIITASRSVLYAYEGKPGDWRSHVAKAAQDMGRQLRKALQR